MFPLESEQILRRIHSHLEAWRADGDARRRVESLREEFRHLQTTAARAGFDDVARLSRKVCRLLAQNADAADADAGSLLHLLAEIYDGLSADLGFVPSAGRDHVASLNGMLTALLPAENEAPNPPPESSAPAVGDASAAPQTRPQQTNAKARAAAVAPAAVGDFLAALQSLADNRTGAEKLTLTARGFDFAVAREVLDAVRIPLTQLLRRSLAQRDTRTTDRADIRLNARLCGAEWVLQYADDDLVFDAKKLAARAVETGMTADSAEVDDAHLLQILTQPRGELAAAYDAAQAVGGCVAFTQRARGVRVQFRLPRALSPLVPPLVLLVKIGGRRFAILARTISRLLRARAAEIHRADGGDYVRALQMQIPVYSIAAQLSPEENSAAAPRAGEAGANSAPAQTRSLALIHLPDRVIALAVDAFENLTTALEIHTRAPASAPRGVIAEAKLTDAESVPLLDPGAFVARDKLQRNGLIKFPLTDFDAT